MQEIIVGMMSKFGYLGVFLLILIENIFPPIPSEVILLFGGFMVNSASLSFLIMIVVSTIGSVVGAIILYYIGYIINKERLKKIAKSKIGEILKLKENDIEYADNWFLKKGRKSVFLCRFVPIVRSLISIPAGMSKMPMGYFLILTTVGSCLWNTVLLGIGNILGENWKSMLGFFQKYSDIVKCLIIFFIGLWLFKKIRNRNKIIVVKEFK